jgi:hypothetical protein
MKTFADLKEGDTIYYRSMYEDKFVPLVCKGIEIGMFTFKLYYISRYTGKKTYSSIRNKFLNKNTSYHFSLENNEEAMNKMIYYSISTALRNYNIAFRKRSHE